uniref:Uncharacterized protein n=1 Tax=Kalanchoe fedtschenkoi TaxID=63787 RepID=A0A7N0UHY0_KALFE
MEILPKLLQYKYPFAVAAAVTTVTVSIVLVAPRMLTVLAYFWPLLASTAVLVAVMVAFGGGMSQPEIEMQGTKVGEGLMMDYVGSSVVDGGGRSQHVVEFQRWE